MEPIYAYSSYDNETGIIDVNIFSMKYVFMKKQCINLLFLS